VFHNDEFERRRGCKYTTIIKPIRVLYDGTGGIKNLIKQAGYRNLYERNIEVEIKNK
jgi:hypothetical protein